MSLPAFVTNTVLRHISANACNTPTACDMAMQVLRELGRYEDSFLDLQQLRKCAPELPGLFEKLQEAAACCLPGAGGSRAGGQA